MFKNILDVNLHGRFDNIMLIGFKDQLDPTAVLGTESICSEYRTLAVFTLGWANSLKNNLEAKAPRNQSNQKGSETRWDLFPLFGGRTCPVCIAQHLAVRHWWNLSAQEQTCFCFGEKPRADITDARWHVYCPQTPERESVGPQRQGKRLLPADLGIPASALKTREPTWILHVEPCALPGWKQSLLSLTSLHHLCFFLAACGYVHLMFRWTVLHKYLSSVFIFLPLDDICVSIPPVVCLMCAPSYANGVFPSYVS